MRCGFVLSLLLALLQEKKPFDSHLLAPSGVEGAVLAQAKQEPPPPVAGVDEVKVAQAIEKGIAFLKTAKSPDFHNAYRNSDVLILWTFIHAGVPQNDPKFQQLLESSMSEPLDKTYKVALLAMCLEEIDRVKYQEKIAHCAQFLVDNQCQNGQWNYGSPTEFIKDVKVPEPAKSVATAAKPREVTKEGKPKVVQHVAVKKMKEGPESGDNSNTQYAALGLRACERVPEVAGRRRLLGQGHGLVQHDLGHLLRHPLPPPRRAAARGDGRRRQAQEIAPQLSAVSDQLSAPRK